MEKVTRAYSTVAIGSVLGLALASLTACNPPATDEYADRSRALPSAEPVMPPIASPDTSEAIWAPTDDTAQRLVFGVPGTPPLFALACIDEGQGPAIRLTRFNEAQDGAQALIAVIGNGHIGRWKVDATSLGMRRVWQGDIAADNANLAAFAGPRKIEATVPGGGSLILHASPLLPTLIENCAARSELSASDPIVLAPPVPGPAPAPVPAPSQPTIPASGSAEAALTR